MKKLILCLFLTMPTSLLAAGQVITIESKADFLEFLDTQPIAGLSGQHVSMGPYWDSRINKEGNLYTSVSNLCIEDGAFRFDNRSKAKSYLPYTHLTTPAGSPLYRRSMIDWSDDNNSTSTVPYNERFDNLCSCLRAGSTPLGTLSCETLERMSEISLKSYSCEKAKLKLNLNSSSINCPPRKPKREEMQGGFSDIGRVIRNVQLERDYNEKMDQFAKASGSWPSIRRFFRTNRCVEVIQKRERTIYAWLNEDDIGNTDLADFELRYRVPDCGEWY